jgi:rod shape determining protein RodA
VKRTFNIWADLDWICVLLYLTLVILGWLNIYAAVYSERHSSIFDIDMRYGKQMIWIIASLIMIVAIMFIDTRFFTFFAYVFYAFALLLLFAVLLFGREVNGARSWFEISGFHLQPTEFAKVATCLAIAKYLSSYGIKIEKLKTLIIVGFIAFTPAALIMLQPDIGSVIVYCAIAFVLYREGFPGGFLFFGFLIIVIFVLALIISQQAILIILIIIALLSLLALNRRYLEFIIGGISVIFFYCSILALNHFFHLRIFHYSALLISAGITCIGAIFFNLFKRISNIYWVVLFLAIAVSFSYSVDYVFDNFLEPHQKHRINILVGKETDLKGTEYNVNQSKIAIGSGGFLGKGYLQGTQTKFNFVPEQSTDFIFCTVGEEWGFVGSLAVIALFGLLLTRIIFLAEKQRSTFSRIYGYGVASILFFHVAINVGMTIGLLPVIGIPLPFFSYGGSSLWAFTILLFIFLRFDASKMTLLK